MRIGVRAHDFGKLPLHELAGRIAEKRFTGVQLALNKALEGFDDLNGILCPGMAWEIREAFAQKNLQIAVLGCYFNMVDPDVAARRRMTERFKEHLRYAREFGCSVVATETGSLNADWSYNPGNREEEAYQTLLGVVRELVREAERFGVFVGIEGVIRHVVHTPERMKRLIEDVDSGNLQVVLDPVNLLAPDNWRDQTAIVSRCLELYGDRIVAVHIKDFTVEGGVMKRAPLGKGLLDFSGILGRIKSRKPFMNLLIEEANPSAAEDDIRFLQQFI